MDHYNPLTNHALFRSLITNIGPIPLYIHDNDNERVECTSARQEGSWIDRLEAKRKHAEAEATAAGVLHDSETHTRLLRARLHLKRKMTAPLSKPHFIALCKSTINIHEAWQSCQCNRYDSCASRLWNRNFAARSCLNAECDTRKCDTCINAIAVAHNIAAQWAMPSWIARVPGQMCNPDFLASENLTSLVESRSTPIYGPETSLSQSHIMGLDESHAPQPLYRDSSFTEQLPLYPDVSLQPNTPITMPMIDFGIQLLAEDQYRHDPRWNKDIIACTYARLALQTSFPKIISITPEQQRAIGMSNNDVYWICRRDKAAKYLLTFTQGNLINNQCNRLTRIPFTHFQHLMFSADLVAAIIRRIQHPTEYQVIDYHRN
jgi:hypothetical protein